MAVSTQAVSRYAKRDLLSSVPKAGVEALVKAVAAEEGRYGVRANGIEVGMLEGEGAWAKHMASGDYTDALLAAAKKSIPLGCYGHVDDIAEMIRFLLSGRTGSPGRSSASTVGTASEVVTTSGRRSSPPSGQRTRLNIAMPVGLVGSGRSSILRTLAGPERGVTGSLTLYRQGTRCRALRGRRFAAEVAGVPSRSRDRDHPVSVLNRSLF